MFAFASTGEPNMRSMNARILKAQEKLNDATDTTHTIHSNQNISDGKLKRFIAVRFRISRVVFQTNVLQVLAALVSVVVASIVVASIVEVIDHTYHIWTAGFSSRYIYTYSFLCCHSFLDLMLVFAPS